MAAMAVVVSNFMETSVVPRQQAALDCLDGGRTAVSFFFVLSGFVLAFNYPGLHDATGRRRFYAARFAPIYQWCCSVLPSAPSGWRTPCGTRRACSSGYAIHESTAPKLAVSLVTQLTMSIGWLLWPL
jgi:hypothetical protein